MNWGITINQYTSCGWMDVIVFMDDGWWMIYMFFPLQFWLIQKKLLAWWMNFFSCLPNWWFGVKAFFSKTKKKEKEASPSKVLRKLVFVKNRNLGRTFLVFFFLFLKERKRSKKDPFMHGYWLIGVDNQKAYYPIHWFRVYGREVGTQEYWKP